MRQIVILVVVLLMSMQAMGCRKDTDLIAEPVVQEEVIPEVVRLHKFKTSAVKKALEFRTSKKSKLC
jgi:hypothetical protein